MTNFIEQLYYGNIDPQECNSELKSDLTKKLNELTQIEKQLGEKLRVEDQKLFSDFSDKYLEFLTTSVVDGFINGFRLGAKFTLNTFKD